MNLSDIAILKFKNVHYCCIISGINKSGVINLLQNIDFNEKRGTLYKFIKTKHQEQFTTNSNLNEKSGKL